MSKPLAPEQLIPNLISTRSSFTAPAPPRSGETVWEEGTVRSVDAADYLYTVETDVGSTLQDIRRITPSPGSVDVLPVGTRVIICKGPPKGPYIWGVISYPPNNDGVIQRALDNENRLIRAGDHVLMAAPGNYVGALDNGASVLQSDPMAHISTHPDGHVVMHSVTYNQTSLFGESGVKHADGRVNYYFRGGSSVEEHTSPLNDDSWTLRIDAGADVNTFSIKVTTTDNKVLSEYYMGEDGSLRVLSEGGRYTRIYSDDTRIVSGDDVTHVKRDSQHFVDGTATDTYKNFVMKCTYNMEHGCGGTASRVVGGNDIQVVQGLQNHKLAGGSVHDIGGDYQRIISPTLLPVHGVIANTRGDFSLMAPLGTVNLYGNTVTLGVTGTTVFNNLTGKYDVVPPVAFAPFHAVMYETLAAWFAQLCVWLDTHAHNTGAGPTTPASVAFGGLTPPSDPALRTLFEFARSNKVKLGG